MKPLISVVMPIYNRAYCIQDAVRSMVDQHFKDWELIVVDDGSDDHEELVKKLQSWNDERIHYYRLEHTGNISKVRNYGNRKAQAEYIVVHDSDDMALPNRLEEIYKAFQENPDVDVVYHGMYTRLHDDVHHAVARGWKPAEPYSEERLLKEQYIPGQVAYKKSVIIKYPYHEDVYVCDDWQMLLRLALNKCKFHMIDKDLYEYVYLEDSINMAGEMSGQRKKDTEVIIKSLKEEFGIEATAEMEAHKLLPGEHQGMAKSIVRANEDIHDSRG